MADAYEIIKTHLDEINQPDYLDKSNEERDELLEYRFEMDGALIDHDEYYSLDYLDMEEVTEYVARLELEKKIRRPGLVCTLEPLTLHDKVSFSQVNQGLRTNLLCLVSIWS